MATLEEIKELLREETGPINSKLDSLSTNFEKLNRAVEFLSAKYDKLLPQVQQINEKLHQHTQSINAAKDELGKVKKSAADAMYMAIIKTQYRIHCTKQYTEKLTPKLENSNQNSTFSWVCLIGL